jgi:hypothetical protein
MRRVGLVAVVALWGCTQSPQQRAEIVSTTFCDCIVGEGLPSAVQMCVTQLEATLSPVSDACFDCVEQHESTCASLLGTCETTCSQNPTPNPGGSP